MEACSGDPSAAASRRFNPPHARARAAALHHRRPAHCSPCQSMLSRRPLAGCAAPPLPACNALACCKPPIAARRRSAVEPQGSPLAARAGWRSWSQSLRGWQGARSGRSGSGNRATWGLRGGASLVSELSARRHTSLMDVGMVAIVRKRGMGVNGAAREAADWPRRAAAPPGRRRKPHAPCSGRTRNPKS